MGPSGNTRNLKQGCQHSARFILSVELVLFAVVFICAPTLVTNEWRVRGVQSENITSDSAFKSSKIEDQCRCQNQHQYNLPVLNVNYSSLHVSEQFCAHNSPPNNIEGRKLKYIFIEVGTSAALHFMFGSSSGITKLFHLKRIPQTLLYLIPIMGTRWRRVLALLHLHSTSIPLKSISSYSFHNPFLFRKLTVKMGRVGNFLKKNIFKKGKGIDTASDLATILDLKEGDDPKD